MKKAKKLLIATAVLMLCVLMAVPVSAKYGHKIFYYEDDYVYFEYDSELLGKMYKAYNGNFFYNCESNSKDFSTDIRIIDKDNYIEMNGADFVSVMIDNAESDSLYTREKTDSEFPEIKLTNKLDGVVNYIKVIGESNNSWMIIELDEVNENDCVIGNMFRQIYDTARPTDYWLKNGYTVEYSNNFAGDINIDAGKNIYRTEDELRENNPYNKDEEYYYLYQIAKEIVTDHTGYEVFPDFDTEWGDIDIRKDGEKAYVLSYVSENEHMDSQSRIMYEVEFNYTDKGNDGYEYSEFFVKIRGHDTIGEYVSITDEP